MRITKKAVAIALTAVMALSTICASAAWVPAGYDWRDLDNIGKIYNEVIDGHYTSNHKIEPLAAEDIVWVPEGYEFDYPHAGYDRLYLEGNYQVITKYNNTFPQWETKFVDYMFELSFPYQIYQRQQTNIPNYGWAWDFGRTPDVDKTLLVPTNRLAEIEESFELIGVNRYDLNGREIGRRIVPVTADLTDAKVQAEIKKEGVPFVPADFDEKVKVLKGEKLVEYLTAIIEARLEEDRHILDMYKEFGIDLSLLDFGPNYDYDHNVAYDYDADGKIDYKTIEVVDDTFFSDENLNRKNRENGVFYVSDEEIANKFPAIYTKVIDGPTLATDGHKVLSKEFLAAYPGSKAWKWDADSVKAWTAPMKEYFDAAGKKIGEIVVENPVSWTEPVYETDEPYYMYQYLVVGNLVFDGRDDLPRVYRKTGGKATPKVEWKYAFAEAAEPFKIIEAKYLDGVLARDSKTGLPVLREATGTYGNYHIEVEAPYIQIWLKDELLDTLLIGAEYQNKSVFGVYGGAGAPVAGTKAGGYVSEDAADFEIDYYGDDSLAKVIINGEVQKVQKK